MTWKALIKFRWSSLARHVFLLYTEMIPILQSLKLPTLLKNGKSGGSHHHTACLLVYPGENTIISMIWTNKWKHNTNWGQFLEKQKGLFCTCPDLCYWLTGWMAHSRKRLEEPTCQKTLQRFPVFSQVTGRLPLTVHTYCKLATCQDLGFNLSAV